MSVFYLIPQMVGAGVLVQPLLGLPHSVGVVIVGAVVIFIVVTAGMVSTTWVQFLKGALLVIFSALLVVLILQRGFQVPSADEQPLKTLGPIEGDWPSAALLLPEMADAHVIDHGGTWVERGLLHVEHLSRGEVTGTSVWSRRETETGYWLDQAQAVMVAPGGKITAIGGSTEAPDDGSPLLPVGNVSRLPDNVASTGPVGPLEFFRTLQQSEVVLWGSHKFAEPDGTSTTVYYQKPTTGDRVLRPGEHPRFKGIRSDDRWTS